MEAMLIKPVKRQFSPDGSSVWFSMNSQLDEIPAGSAFFDSNCSALGKSFPRCLRLLEVPACAVRCSLRGGVSEPQALGARSL
jgi:hypothetical protein